ncbi:MAG: GspH/FimT family pseudopilin [Planctomycetota bacterium]
MTALRPLRARRRPRRLRRAFTLVELLVTIGILILVLGVTVAGFQGMFRNVGVRGASRKLRAAIDMARIQAIQQRRPIRFEAQLIPGTTTHQWQVIGNAGDQTQEPRQLPDFVAVATNAGQSPGTSGMDPPYRGAVGDESADEDSGGVERIAVTFGPDGSVKRWELRDGTESLVEQRDDPVNLFAIRLTNLRDVQEGQFLQRWLVIIPLTGGVQPHDAGSESY